MTRRRSPIRRAALLALGLAGAPIVLPATATAEPELLDRVVAVVDEDIVLLSHLERSARSSPQLQEAIATLGPGATEQQLEQKLKEIRQLVLDELIDTVLIKKEAARFQINASEADIQRYLQQLAASNNYPSVPELRKAVIDSGEFGSWEEYRQDIRDQITVYKATSMLANWAVTEAQMREYYRKQARGEDARVEVDRYAFAATSTSSNARDEVFAQAQGIARRLRAGEASETVAAELSGDVEDFRRTISRGEIAPQLEDALFPAQAGEVVGPLASGQGYIVFRVVKHLESEVLSYDEAKEGIRQKLEAEAYEKAEREFRQQLRSKAHIDIRL
ncbi:MAG: peptidyl-prolyl cis-trans isomerase [Nannocystaceae bacterium]